MSIIYLLITISCIYSINGQQYGANGGQFQNPYSATPQPWRMKAAKQSLWDLLQSKYPKQISQKPSHTMVVNQPPSVVANGANEIQDDLNSTNTNDEGAVKARLLGLLNNGKALLDRRMVSTDNIHDLYKNDPVYRIGYLISFINKAHDTLTDLYAHVEKEKDRWDAIKVLNAYEQMQKSNKFLTHLIGVLKSFASEDDFQRHQPPKHQSSIAWSYYD